NRGPSDRFAFSRSKRAIIRSMELLIIDEISMVRADTLDAVDDALRRIRRIDRPFGGVQVLMIGDVQQLSPVATAEDWEILREYYNSPYFFDSKVLQQADYVCIELDHIYRQRDTRFIDLLSKVRQNCLSAADFSLLNSRYIPNFEPSSEEGYITLCSHNNSAKQINESHLESLEGEEFRFEAEIQGEFPEYMFPIEKNLTLKEGTRVMFAKNDLSPERRYVNGTLGTVIELDEKEIVVQTDEGKVVNVEKVEWENVRYEISKEDSKIITETIGTFRQYPLKLAWAITIHKSQGLTFDKTIIDAAFSFSHGQVYVALSRCRTLEGIVLRKAIPRSAIVSDASVDIFQNALPQRLPTNERQEQDRKRFQLELQLDAFDFEPLIKSFTRMTYFAKDEISHLFPQRAERWEFNASQLRTDVGQVALKFQNQLKRLAAAGDSAAIEERMAKGAAYFLEKINADVVPLLIDVADIEFDDKSVNKVLDTRLRELTEDTYVKIKTLEYALEPGFDVKSYLQTRSGAIAKASEVRLNSKGVSTLIKGENVARVEADSKKSRVKKLDPGELQNIHIFDVLCAWRNSKASDMNLPAYCIAHQKTLVGIANALPSNYQELLHIKGVGKVFVSQFGPEIIDIIRQETGK
ncbi:MAG: HRDC domain-containing protein, partial [Bacteroidales bacterium]|nr:HRDC domain-containing protein [Bacteroidales bacterium]